MWFGYIVIGVGTFSMAVGIFNWTWYFEFEEDNPFTLSSRALFGHKGARIVAIIQGLILMVAGLLVLFR